MTREKSLAISWSILDQPWSESHGFDVTEGKIGLVGLYLGIHQAIDAKSVLVIGSGAGFVPLLFARNTKSEVFLVDARLPDSGSGSPMDVPENVFYSQETDSRVEKDNAVTKFRGLSSSLLQVCIERKLYFDLIFIDGDHSTSGFTSDLTLSLKCVNPLRGAIICHDANQDNIKQVLRDIAPNFLLFESGAGCAVLSTTNSLAPLEARRFDSNSVETLGLIIRSALAESDASRWDYLASNTFSSRLQKYFEVVNQKIEEFDLKISSVLEVGGNPAPFIDLFVQSSQVPSMKHVSIEPYVSPVASAKFQQLEASGLEIIDAISALPLAFETDALLIIGFDLSLSRSFDEFLEGFMRLRKLATQAQIVVVEHPRYEPAKRLADLLLEGMDILFDEEYEFGKAPEVSIDKLFTIRRLRVARAGVATSKDIPHASISELVWYAKYHAIPGVPRPDKLQIADTGGADLVFTIFDCYPVERVATTGEEFVWLRPSQTVEYPTHRRVLELTLAWEMPNRQVECSRSGLLITVVGKKVVIRRPRLRTQFQVDFPFFIPSEETPKSKDSRRLSYPVTSYRFRYGWAVERIQLKTRLKHLVSVIARTIGVRKRTEA